MSNPVSFPLTPLPITDAINSSAEQFVANLLQIFAAGASGTTDPYNAPDPTAYPTGPDEVPSTMVLTSRQQQLFFRQLGVAISKTWTLGGGDPGVTSNSAQFIGQCLVDATIGELVYVYQQGRVVRKADPLDYMKVPAVGCIVYKPSETSAAVQTNGIVQGVFSNLQPGQMYFAGRNGRPTLWADMLPSSGETIFNQPIGIAIDTNILLMAPSTNLTRVRG